MNAQFNIGNKYNHTFTVNENVYLGFLNTFKDNNPLHTNAEYAKNKGFQGKVMHGNILNGFISFFIGECLSTKDVIIHSQTIEFCKTVLNFHAEIDELFESVKVVKFKYYFCNSENKKVAKGTIQIGFI